MPFSFGFRHLLFFLPFHVSSCTLPPIPAALAFTAVCPFSYPLLPEGFLSTLPLPSLPDLFAPTPDSPPDPITTSAIIHTLSLYPLIIDSKNFSALSQFFTPDVIANYSAPIGVLTGLSAVQSTLEASLFPFLTQHAYSTQIVKVLEDGGFEAGLGGGCTAMSISYFTATHWGRTANNTGKYLYAHGQYQDFWVKNGMTGEWRVKGRNLVYMGNWLGNYFS